MSSEIVLYDLPSRGRTACWSLNPWKARASLNFKGLPYKTEFVEYPDLAPKFKALGVPANDKSISLAEYSSPVAKMPDGSYIMDSRAIAEALEKLQPEPSLHMDDGETIDRTLKTIVGIHGCLGPIVMPRVPDLLNPRSEQYFRETREKRFGMPLHEVAKSEKAGESAWEAAEPLLNDLKSIVNEDQQGPYVLGQEPSFSDLIIAGFFAFEKKVDRGDLYDRLLAYDASFPELVKACQKWFERDD